MAEKERNTKKPFKRLLFMLSCTAALCVAIGVLTFFNSRLWEEKKDAAVYVAQETSLSLDLRLNEIFLKGRNRTAKKTLLDALNVERGMPILAINLNKAKESVEKLPWIKSVRIERRLPHILYVEVTERQPIAVWQHKGVYKPVDSEGNVVDFDTHDLNGLPLVVGTNAPAKTPALLNVLKQEPALFARVRAATYMSDRRWNVILDSVDNGIVVRLPEKNPQTEWGRLEKLNRTHGLLKRTVTLIDLRFPEKVVVQFEKPKKTKEKAAFLEIKKETGI